MVASPDLVVFTVQAEITEREEKVEAVNVASQNDDTSSFLFDSMLR